MIVTDPRRLLPPHTGYKVRPSLACARCGRQLKHMTMHHMPSQFLNRALRDCGIKHTLSYRMYRMCHSCHQAFNVREQRLMHNYLHAAADALFMEWKRFQQEEE